MHVHVHTHTIYTYSYRATYTIPSIPIHNCRPISCLYYCNFMTILIMCRIYSFTIKKKQYIIHIFVIHNIQSKLKTTVEMSLGPNYVTDYIFIILSSCRLVRNTPYVRNKFYYFKLYSSVKAVQYVGYI